MIEIPDTIPNSPVRNPSFYLSTNHRSDDSLTTTPQRINSNIKSIFQDYKVKFFLSTIGHISIQIAFLSLLEPLLYFNYIIVVEKDIFYQQLSSISDYSFIYTDSQIIRNEPFYPLLIDFLHFEKIYVDRFYDDLTQSSLDKIDSRKKLFNKLQQLSYTFTFTAWIIMISYMSLMKYIYPKKKLIKYFSHHIILIFFIGLYELWFFQNVILNYIPWSKEEIELYLFQCFWEQTTEHYPEIASLQDNVTISCPN